MPISAADLPLNANGSVYHLNLLPDEIADTVIFVGDPRRAIRIAKYFDLIDAHKSNRELVTYTGFIGKKRISVIGTGMGAGNIDIVMNELDALVNVNLKTREIKKKLTKLKIIRLGTGGSLHRSLEIDQFVVTTHALGFDNLLNFYNYTRTPEEAELQKAAIEHFKDFHIDETLYGTSGHAELITQFSDFAIPGITLSTIGFYGPQFRNVRAPLPTKDFLKQASTFTFHQQQALNFEMETAAIYGLGQLLGHHCCSISAIVANRETNKFSTNHNLLINKMIETVLAKIS